MKRQKRHTAQEFRESMETQLGKEVNLVLQNGQSFHGRLLESPDNTALLLQLRQRKRSFPWHQIAEVLTDYPSDF